jgi:hypothetical protein
LAVFASLGVAALIMLSLALVQTTKFVAGSDRIAAALSERQESLATTAPANDGKTIATNATLPAAQQAGARTRTPGKV